MPGLFLPQAGAAAPSPLPGAPSITSATVGGGSILVTLAAPTSGGRAAITSYLAVATPRGGGATLTASSPSPVVVVRGMAPGKTYLVYAIAASAAGSGPPSPTFTVGSSPAPSAGGGGRLQGILGVTTAAAAPKAASVLLGTPTGGSGAPFGVVATPSPATAGGVPVVASAPATTTGSSTAAVAGLLPGQKYTLVAVGMSGSCTLVAAPAKCAAALPCARPALALPTIVRTSQRLIAPSSAWPAGLATLPLLTAPFATAAAAGPARGTTRRRPPRRSPLGCASRG